MKKFIKALEVNEDDTFLTAGKKGAAQGFIGSVIGIGAIIGTLTIMGALQSKKENSKTEEDRNWGNVKPIVEDTLRRNEEIDKVWYGEGLSLSFFSILWYRGDVNKWVT